jgi:hypothetical protein
MGCKCSGQHAYCPEVHEDGPRVLIEAKIALVHVNLSERETVVTHVNWGRRSHVWTLRSRRYLIYT